ncbi:MAG: porin family protein [Flavobacteriales bacterium]|jgi:hypothetical protein
MKKQIITMMVAAAAVMSSTVASAQLNFGGRAGLNLANQVGDVEESSMLTSFYVGAALQLDLGDKLFLAPELNFSIKGAADKSTSSFDILGTTTKTEYDAKIKTSYIEVPVNIGFRIGEKLHVKAGPYIGLMMGANYSGDYTSTVTNSAGTTTVSESIDEDVKEFYNGTDFGINVGLGFQTESGFGVEARLTQGLSNLADPDLETDDKISNQVISVGVFYMLGN